MEKYRKVSTGLIERKVGDELVILQSDTGEVHQLNEVAACVWRSLTEDRTLTELVGHITDQFDVNRATAEQDAKKLLAQFVSLKLIEVILT